MRMFAKAIPPILWSSSALLAQGIYPPLEISEVLIRPAVGGHQVVELIAGNAALTTSGYHLVVGGTAVAMPTVTVTSSGVLLLHLGIAGTNAAGNVFLPFAPAMGLVDA